MNRTRIADVDDLPTLMAMASEFHIAGREGSLPRWEESVESWALWFASCFEHDDRLCIIAELDKEPVGFMTAVVCPAYYNPTHRTATETAVWIRKPHRRNGLAREFIHVLKRWAKLVGCQRVAAGSKQQLGSRGVKALLESEGFRLDEKLYTVEV